jgi:hypothetical protein
VGGVVTQTRNFCDDASDWLRFDASFSQVITITTASSGQRADTNLALYAADAETLLAGNDDLKGTEDYSSEIVWQAQTTGVYYLHITNRAGLVLNSTEYSLTIEGSEAPSALYLPLVYKPSDSMPALFTSQPSLPQTPDGVIYHMCPDDYETDDSWQQAKPIVPGEAQVHSFDSNPGIYAADKDVVRFEIAKGDTVVFSIQQKINTQPLMELYDASGSASNVTGMDQLQWTAAGSGLYYLSVSPTTDSFGCSDVAGYILKMELKPLEKIYLPAVFFSTGP